jgi:hypothetical protein
MSSGFLNLPWFLWAGLALVIAVVYSFIWPKKSVTETSRVRFFIVRWGHALTWLLLGLNFLLRGNSPALDGAANILALAGALFYALFILMTFVIR